MRHRTIAALVLQVVLAQTFPVAAQAAKPRPTPMPTATTLEDLVSHPGRSEGQFVRVVGNFRGRNLYADLPAPSQRHSDDWVIKDKTWAAWVTGHKPKGSGFSLDPGLKENAETWVEVVGRVETHGGVTYLKATDVSLAAMPTPAPLAASSGPIDPDLVRGIELYKNGDYDQAVLVLDAAARRLAASPGSSKWLAQVYFYMGASHLGQGREVQARARFRDALANDRDMRPSPRDFSPSVLDAFEAMREQLAAQPSSPPAKP